MEPSSEQPSSDESAGKLPVSEVHAAYGSPAERLPWCLLGACVWALPHLGWGARPGVGALAFVALVGSGLASLALVAVGLGRRAGTRSRLSAEAALSLGLGLALLPSSALAYWLAVATHHRPLGAVTFAVGAAINGAVGVVIARRVLALRAARSRRLLANASLLCAALGALGLAGIAAQGIAADSTLRSAVPDLALGMLLAVLAAFMPAVRWAARLERVALVACLCLWSITFGLVRFEPDVRARVKSVPVIAGVVGLALR